ncbi:MAG: SBBP repeat-containing protein [Thermoanaerobaculia bacterium]
MQHPLRLCFFLAIAAISIGGAGPLAAGPGSPTQARVAEAYGRLPLSFEANEGQVDKPVKFLSRGQGYTLFLTPAEAVLSLRGPRHETALVHMQMAGGQRAQRVVGLDPQVTQSNYFLGNDPSRWHTGVSHYARVRYEDVYPGIDLVYRGNQRQLEYDFVIAAGADPGRIRLAFQGVDALKIGAQGELVVHTAQGDLVQQPPVLYQEAEEKRQPVEGHYVLRTGHQVGFAVGRYDRSRPLIIDPVLTYSTFLGDSGDDEIRALAVDAAGNVYVTGLTTSTTFPGVNGSSIQPAHGVNSGFADVFVTKINPTGTAILYSTFLGGSATEWGFAIAVDAAGNAYITGYTRSTTFPGVNAGSLQPTYGGGDSDVFVTKINPTGTAIVYSTFLGGSDAEWGVSIAVDGAGNAYVTGFTNSITFPGVNGSSIQPTNAGGTTSADAFVTKINPGGTAIVYSTFLGGSGTEAAYAIAVDGAGNAYVTGETHSATFPGVNGSSIQPANGGGSDAFVTKINPAGTAIVYSTFLGGSLDDSGRAIAVDSAGSAYVTGQATSPTFPGVNGNSLQPANGGGNWPGDAFVTKLNPAGTAIVYSTFLGGSGIDGDGGFGIAVDSAGNAYLTGETASTTFPGVNATSIQPANAGGGADAFVTKINPTGSAIVYSTFLGGSGGDAGLGIAVDGAGNTYVAGNTTSTTFTGVDGSSLQPANGGGADDGFVTKIKEPGLAFYTVTPCRMVDTRNAVGPLGGPALQPGARVFVLTGLCGVPATAKTLSVNLTVTQPTALGYLSLLPGDDKLVLPGTSAINFAAGRTRANNASALLAYDGSGSIKVINGGSGSVHFILDVNGYFE